MSPIAAITGNNTSLSFRGSKKAKTDDAKNADTPKKIKHQSSFMKKRIEAKYGIAYDSLSEDAKKVVNKNAKLEIILTLIGAVTGCGVVFFKGKKFFNGFTDTLINSGKNVMRKFKPKMQPLDEGADTVSKFFLKKMTSVLDKKSKVADESVRDIAKGVITKTQDAHKEALDTAAGLISDVYKKGDFSEDSISPVVESLKKAGLNDLAEEAKQAISTTEAGASSSDAFNKLAENFSEERSRTGKGITILNFDANKIAGLKFEISGIDGYNQKTVQKIQELYKNNNKDGILSISSEEFTKLINSTLRTSVDNASKKFNDPKAYTRMEKLFGENGAKSLVAMLEKKGITGIHSLGDLAIAGGLALTGGAITGKGAGAIAEGKSEKVADEEELLEKIKEEGAETTIKGYADTIAKQGTNLLQNALIPSAK